MLNFRLLYTVWYALIRSWYDTVTRIRILSGVNREAISIATVRRDYAEQCHHTYSRDREGNVLSLFKICC